MSEVARLLFARVKTAAAGDFAQNAKDLYGGLPESYQKALRIGGGITSFGLPIVAARATKSLVGGLASAGGQLGQITPGEAGEALSNPRLALQGSGLMDVPRAVAGRGPLPRSLPMNTAALAEVNRMRDAFHQSQAAKALEAAKTPGAEARGLYEHGRTELGDLYEQGKKYVMDPAHHAQVLGGGAALGVLGLGGLMLGLTKKHKRK